MEKNMLDACSSQTIEPIFENFGIRQEGLDHPTKEFVIETYQRLKNIIKDVLCQIIDEPNNETPELLSESDLVFDLLRFLNNKLIYPDCIISLIDFYAPTARRTKIRLRLLVTILEFYKKQIDPSSKIVMRRKEQALKVSTMKRQKDEILSQLAKEAENVAQTQDQINLLRNHLKQSESNYELLKQVKDDKTQHFKNLQQELKIKIVTNENKQTLLKNLKINIASLNEQIVTTDSYDSLNDLKNDLFKKCEELESNTVNISEGLSGKVLDIEHFQTIYKQIETLKVLARELLSQKCAFDEVKNEYEQLQNDFNMKLQELEAKNESILKIKTDNKESNDNIQSIMHKNNNLIKQIIGEIEQINVEQQEEKELQKKFAEKEVALQHAKSIIIKEIEELKDKISYLKNHYTCMYTRMMNAENTLTTNFNKALEHVIEVISNNE